ncbi:USP8 family protein [Megaselia abdita]
MAKKDLYLATSLDDLSSQWKKLPEIGNKNWKAIACSLKKMIKSADEHYLKGDEEKAYVLYMRFFAILMRKEYFVFKNEICSEIGGTTTCNSAMDRLEKLETSLKTRYEKRNPHESLPHPQYSTQKTPEPVKMDISKLGTINSETLFKKLKEKVTLLIDVRTKDDFQASQIAYAFCLNIPGDRIQKGFSAGKIQDILEANQKKLWSSRSVKDDVVIMGWNDNDTATHILKHIMQYWDPDTTYKSPIRILEKGYEHFLTLFPTLCTDPHFTVSRAKDDESDNIDEVEYPHINDIVMKDDIAVGAPIVNRAHKTNAMRIYEENRNVNDVLKERKILSDEHTKTNKQLEDAERNIHSSQVPSESEEYKRLEYMILELQTEKKNQQYKNELLTKELQELKNAQSQSLKLPEPEKIDDDDEEEPMDISEPVIKDVPINRPVKVIKEIPYIDRSVKPSFNNHIDFSYQEEQQDSVLTGLKNLGNTCYMNSILQCLFSSFKFRKFLTATNYRDSINYTSKTEGNICEETAGLFKRMTMMTESNYVECSQLKSNFGTYQKMFRGRDQQDAHEFLTIFIDCLHLELNTLTISRPINSASEKCWNEFTKSKESRVLQLFYGQIKSTVKCKTCEKESATYETFSNLSLELPMQSNICSLFDCLSMYFGGEKISGWICPNCKQKREAIKKLDISRLPEFLVIHLKRFFVNTEYMSNVYKKKENYVKFPLDNLDISPHLTRSELMKSTPKAYELYAVCNHYGTMESGHYTAFCRRNTNKYGFCV